MIEEIKQRRSIRKFKEKQVDPKLLTELLEVAARASTTGNMQLYSVIISQDKEQLKALAPAHFNQPAFVGAPTALTFCADYNRFNLWCKARKAEPGYDNFQSFVAAALDTTLLAQNFATLAEHAGLGICFIGTTTYNAPQIAQVLKLPKYVVPVTTLSVGYPDEMPEQQDRIPVSGFVHQETYKDYTAEDIDKVFSEKESLEANRKFVEINGKETLAQVFTDIRYTKKDGDTFSKIYWDFICKQFEMEGE